MTALRTALAFCLSALLALPALADDWKPQTAPLMTRWAKDVSPQNAHPEYPRPQMVRKDWLNLNGLWQLEIAEKGDGPAPTGKDLAEKILVPFPVESALSGVMKPAHYVWYRRTFEVPAAWKGNRVLLHFQAVDWDTTVLVNGKQLGTHRGGYDPFSLDVTDALTASGPQELIVKVLDPSDAGYQPHGKQVNKPGGIMYTATTGIWQTVWLEPVPAARIAGLTITPDLDASALRLTVQGEGTAAGQSVEAVVQTGGSDVVRASGSVGSEIVLAIPKESLKFWTPDTPFLYDLAVTLRDGQRAVDQVTSYFGMRKIALGKDEQGILRPMLNGKFLFQMGPLDQGFWPDGLYTAPTDEALRYDIEVTKRLGFNMTRKHVKVEPERWYYWCDKLGLLVWQDMPAGSNAGEAGKANFEHELQRMIDGRRNHPAIIMWVVFNEGWGQHDTERYVDLVRGWDKTRLVSNASGWTDKRCGDVIDAHNYPGPGSPKPEETRTAVLGEFGGLGLGVDGHTWAQKTWGYRGMASAAELTRRYESLLRGVWGLKDNPGLSAAVYTQITDVETECNGLLTYDREIIKVDADRTAAANRGQVPKVSIVVPTAKTTASTWRYTTQQPADGWEKPGFDDSAWQQGPAGFGTKGTPGSFVGTEWKSGDIWIRRTVELPAAKPEELSLWMHHDEDAQVYLNGVSAVKADGYTTDYEEFAISPEAAATLKQGANAVAVHCRQTQGGQYIDVGFVKVSPAGK
jgi:hypothetical protein